MSPIYTLACLVPLAANMVLVVGLSLSMVQMLPLVVASLSLVSALIFKCYCNVSGLLPRGDLTLFTPMPFWYVIKKAKDPGEPLCFHQSPKRKPV